MSKPKRERSLAANEAKAVLRNVRTSPIKLNLVAEMIRGMKASDALTQLAFSNKRIANDVRFGLAAGVWTRDIGRAIRMSENLQAGTVWVNTYRAVSFMAPFGGYKDSGLGRESGMEAVADYLQTKCVWINTGVAAGNPFVMR